MQDIRVAIIQTILLWEDIPGNLTMFGKKISDIKEAVDLIVLPEMFNTGFSMNPAACAENTDSLTTEWMRAQAKKKNCAICGSVLSKEGNRYYNRLIWMMPDGNYFYYDKKHLFRYAGEHEVFSQGRGVITTKFNEWNIRPLVCYDLRFPVWCRNAHKNGVFDFDVLIFVANWPEKRRNAWMSLLIARAIENQSYVIGVNRVGTDGKGNSHAGDSIVIDPKGNVMMQIPSHKEAIEIATLSYAEMQSYREHFRVALDWDRFTIEE
ncbi:MAG: amidohydrolase [Bacteroidales bacterium]|jgi:predicted amidohydrolase